MSPSTEFFISTTSIMFFMHSVFCYFLKMTLYLVYVSYILLTLLMGTFNKLFFNFSFS